MKKANLRREWSTSYLPSVDSMYIFRIIDMENIHRIVCCEILPTKEQQGLYDRLSKRYVSFYLIFVKQKNNLCQLQYIMNFHQDPPTNIFFVCIHISS